MALRALASDILDKMTQGKTYVIHTDIGNTPISSNTATITYDNYTDCKTGNVYHFARISPVTFVYQAFCNITTDYRTFSEGNPGPSRNDGADFDTCNCAENELLLFQQPDGEIILHLQNNTIGCVRIR